MERIDGTGKAVQTPIGNLPAPGAIDISGLDVTEADMDELLAVDKEAWKAEIESIRENYKSYGDKLPKELGDALATLEAKLG